MASFLVVVDRREDLMSSMCVTYPCALGLLCDLNSDRIPESWVYVTSLIVT